MKQPLSGMTVLDIGTLTPGKFCTSILADMGASVLRIERPSGKGGKISHEDLALNRGKRSITLDLRTEAGREVVLRLARRCDAIIESYRPGVAKRLGIDYPSLHEHNQRLVYCSLSGFGQTGPMAHLAGFDLQFVARSGLLSAITGGKKAPSVPGAYLSDAVSGLTAALAICAAMVGARQTSEGYYVDLAMLDSIFAMLAVSHGVLAEAEAGDGDAYDSPFYAIYETKDGRHLALGAIRAESSRALCRELGRSELAEAGFDTPEKHAALTAFLREAFKSAPASEWMSRLTALDIEAALTNSPREAVADPQLVARAMVPREFAPEIGHFRRIATPVRFSTQPAEPSPAPRIGQHSEEVLLELGYSAADISLLREQGVI
jgi:crotonobetainyl-CoA:carnitine CoA-transferase CaiB-like acyl-CoA transferase